MKIAISNLAWETPETDSVAQFLHQSSIKGVEIAPGKIWSNPIEVSSTQAQEYRDYWLSYGIEIVSLQSLLYGKNLTIFDSEAQRQETRNYLVKIIELAAKLGAKVLVFGSLKNRRVGNLSPHIVQEIAVEFFDYVGTFADQYGIKFCIEPNPRAYNCDYINTSQEGYTLVTKVNNPGFGLHLDAAGMTLSQEEITPALEEALPQLCHFHISEPNLQVIGNSKQVKHQLFGETLKLLNYSGWVSIEMLAQNQDNNLADIHQAIRIAKQYYE